MTLITTILLGFIIAIAAPFAFRVFGAKTGLILAVYPLIIFIQVMSGLFSPDLTEASLTQIPWAPSMGLWFSFRVDGLARLMAAVIAGIGVLVIWYAGDYLKGDPRLPRFYCLIIFFMTAMLGLTISENALLFFIFWELTSISSFLLIGFDHHEAQSRASAWQALLVTGGGGLTMLAGLILLYIITGSFEMGNWIASAGEIQNHPFAIPAFLLLVVGAMTKSAQFPFHFWLPNAMKAPTPVSAYLHSATMVKAGVFLLFRLFPILGGMSLWPSVLIPVGALTIITGSLLAMGQSDLKRLLAYSTVSALGTMVLLIGIGSPLSIKTALVFLLVHAMYKGSLFLVAGGIDHATGTRDVRVIGGLSRNLPLTSTAAVLAGLSMAGLPPLAGFAAKELIYETTLADTASLALTVLLLAGNIVNIMVAGWISWSVFFGKDRGDIHAHHESINLYLPPLLLAVSGLFSGIWITETGAGIIAPALAAVLQKTYPVKLSLWHGFTPMFFLSLLTLLLGFVLVYQRRVIQQWMEKICHLLEPAGPASLYNRTIKGIISFANFQTSVLQNGYLRVYIMVILFTTFILTIGTMVFHLRAFPIRIWSIPRFYDVILLGIIITASIKVTQSNSRLTTIALLGSIGYCIAILFLLYSAPDLAMVQFSIETLVVILFILALYKLPKFSQLSATPVKLFNLVIAIIGGGMMTFLMLLASSHPIESSLSTFFMENSYLAAKGRNVVNVILVDFRGFDTIGEISVLGIAAIGVYALIRFTRKARIKTHPPKGDQS